MDADAVERVAVLGAGPTGCGVAEVAALGGLRVTLQGLSAEDVERGRDRIARSLDDLVERGRLTDRDADATLSRVEPVVDLAAAVADADVVVEAVPDRRSVRRDLYDSLAGLPPERAVLATTAPGTAVERVATLSDRPARTCGLRTFPPPVRRRHVEVVGGPATTGETLELVAGVMERLGRSVLRLPDDPPGGVVDRVLAPAANEAAWLVTDGASPAEVDTSARAVGLDTGPLALADRVGLDRHLAVLERLDDVFGETYDPAPALRDRVDDGWLGTKTGGGFHDGTATPPDAAGDRAAGRRVLAVLARETAALDADGVATPETTDRAVRLATGLSRGPAQLADAVGLDDLRETLTTAHQATAHPRCGNADALATWAAEARSFGDDVPGDVRVERETEPRGVARIVIDRPERANALTLATARALARSVESIADDDEVRAVVLAGARGQFCAGIDVAAAGLATMDRSAATRFAREGQRALARIASADIPVVAAVTGACLGAGLTLAACADLRVASNGATFGHPARNLGLAPAWGADVRLPPLLGEGRTTELLLTGDRYGAAGLVDDGFLTAAPGDDTACLSRARALAADLADASPAAVSAICRSVGDVSTIELTAAAETFGRLVVSDRARAALRSHHGT